MEREREAISQSLQPPEDLLADFNLTLLYQKSHPAEPRPADRMVNKHIDH